MRAPLWWYSAPSAPAWQARALAPLAALYARATARRVARPPALAASIPVICIGNINAGGTGKTPTVIALAQRIPGAHVVSRGHGGALTGPVRVDERAHNAADVGDEPLLAAAFGVMGFVRARRA